MYLAALAAGLAWGAPGEFDSRVRPFVNRYCRACHHAGNKTAGVALDGLKDAGAVGANVDLWERAFRKLRTAEMPPPNAPKPPAGERAAVSRWIESELDHVAAARPEPGRPGIHRLNKAEYNNALRDLLAIDFDAGVDFPADDAGYGFDNIAGALSLPPVLAEKYMKAAERATRAAVGNRKWDAVLDRYSVDRRVDQTKRLGAEYPEGSRGGATVRHGFPADGEYLLRLRLRGDAGEGRTVRVEFRLDGQTVHAGEAKLSAKETDEESRRVEVRLSVKAGRRAVQATLYDDEERLPPARRLAVDWIEVGGPFRVTGPGETESRKAIFSCRPAAAGEEAACAERILGRLARRAFRRTVTAAEVAALMKFYAMGREGGTFDDGVQLALKAMLMSPKFLFRVERESGPGVRPLTDFELASRLSFFLWSTIPDEALLRLAEQGRLRQPAVLRAEVKRMLADGKARALTRNFAGQWLHLRNLDGVKPDPERFPEYNAELREAFRRETEMLFEAVVREDLSVMAFVEAGFTFLNERLAKHYGMEGVTGDAFRRVELGDGRRGGVLTQASVLTISSYPTRTSPVIRGKWILENLLGAPPPPPPPDVPPLEEKGIGASVSLRKQMEQHRASPACASCHARMDPIGFSLENYDAIGRWRTHDGAFEIDAAGTLPDGQRFANAAELKKLLSANPREFVLGLGSKLMTYALGRGVESTDQAAVRAVEREAAARGYRFSALVEGIVMSPQFRMKKAGEVHRAGR
jgi:hypothetical protein